MSRYEVRPPGDHEPIVGPTGMMLRPIRASDIPALFRWRHDPEVIEWWDEPPASEVELAEEELEPDVNPCWRFIIELDGRDVGYIQYWHPYADTDSDWSAGVDIILGAPDDRNRGIGTEAVRTMLDYLFEVKRVHRVTIDPDVRNARAIRAYQKAGFRIIEDEWPETKERWLTS